MKVTWRGLDADLPRMPGYSAHFFFPFCCLSCVPFTLVPTYLQRYAEPWPQSRMCPLAVLNLTFKAERLIPGLELKGRTGPESCHLWTLHVIVILRHTPPTGGLKLPSRCGLRREAQPGARIMAGRWAESSCGQWLLELVWKTKYIWQCCVRAGVLGHVPSLQPRGPQPTRLLCPWNFPATILERVCHFLLEGIFPTQRSNPSLRRLLHWQVDSYH